MTTFGRLTIMELLCNRVSSRCTFSRREKNLSRRKSMVFPQPERWKKVKRSMAAIKVVLGERKCEKIAAHKEKMAQRDAVQEE